jgi:hypothetical protein
VPYLHGKNSPLHNGRSKKEDRAHLKPNAYGGYIYHMTNMVFDKKDGEALDALGVE